MTTHYELLGVDPRASEEEVRRSYRALALRHHPDTQSVDDPGAVEIARQQMAALNLAWAVLSDCDARRNYDLELDRQAPSPTTPPGSARPERPWTPLSERFDALDDDPEFEGDSHDPPPRRPSDLLFMAPVAILAAALGLFLLSLFLASDALRNLGLLLIPVAGLAFLIAPLFAMIRAKSQP